ncbi:MAG: hypothetical protein IJZ00_06120 [Lachnospiraceae bacterium]|nr:hypothetical protein [Lachnospiraceae bacterium]
MDNKGIQKIKENKVEVLSFALCIGFYMVFCFGFGVQLCADSNSYINMTSAREPVYPLLLAFFRLVCGETYYLWGVIIFQNMLMAFAVWKLTMWFRKHFSLPPWMVFICLAFHFGVALLCQFAAGRASIYPNSILTEGITLALWLIFINLLLEALFSGKVKYVALALVLAAVMMDTRKQMAVTYIVLFFTLVLGWIKRNGYWKKIGLTVGMIVISIGLAIAGTRVYNLVLRGEFAQNTRDMNLVLTTTLYVADPEDASLIEEDAVRVLFEETMRILDEKECNYRYAKPGWRNLEAHYGAHYDMITIDTTANGFIDYAIERGFSPGLEAEQEADRMSGVIVKSLLPDNIGTYLKVYLASMANGLINTVAKRHTVLDWYALVAYALYVGLTVVSMLKKETRAAGLVALTVLCGILVNVGVAAALIFCQTRYMIYNMALFYMALFLMGYENAKVLKKGKGKKEETI